MYCAYSVCWRASGLPIVSKSLKENHNSWKKSSSSCCLALLKALLSSCQFHQQAICSYSLGLLQSDVAERLGGTFEIFIQVGAVVAVVGYYHEDILRQVRTVSHDRSTQHLWITIVIASIPSAILGFLLRDVIKDVLFSPIVVAVTLIVGGLIFILVERRLQDQEPETTALENISYSQALKIGLAQTLALIPGVSRSGASIVGGLLVNVNRPVATQHFRSIWQFLC